MTVSLFIACIRAFSALISKNPIDTYIFLLYGSISIMTIAEFINYFTCEQSNTPQAICIITWILFSVSLDWTLIILTMLQFFTYFITQTQESEFIEEISKSRKQFIFFAIIIPIFGNLLNIFAKNTYYNIFMPPTNRFQVIILFTPISVILILITIFNSLIIQILKKSEDGTKSFRKGYIWALKLQLYILWPVYIYFLIIIIMTQFSSQLDFIYLIALMGVNTQVFQYTILYGINPYITKMQLLKLSKLIGIRASDIEESDKTHSQIQTQIVQITQNGQTDFAANSKTSELNSRHTSEINLNSKRKITQIVNSDKVKQTTMELYDHPRSQNVNINQKQ